MRRFIILFLFSFTLLNGIFAQSMSDEQVIQYVLQAQQQGKTQTQMATELLQRGVTMEQVERIKQKYDQNGSASSSLLGNTNSSSGRALTAPIRQRQNTTTDQSGTSLLPLSSDSLANRPLVPSSEIGKNIFGKDMFTNQYLSFEPNANIATPENYRLGPGDEVIIDIWGVSEKTIQQVISPEGSIIITNIGPVYLNGMTIKEANSYLQNEFKQIYSGIEGNVSQIKLTLGQTRSIQISIMGEVAVPGTYTLSAFASVFHALYYAGGINSIGGLRSVQVIRNGKKIADVDIYSYILEGKTNDNIRLMEDDVILVQPYKNVVSITGKVKRPMYYEMKEDETIATLLKFTGGFTGDAYTKKIRLIRLSGHEKQIYNIDEMNFSSFKLYDQDSLIVEAVLDRYENKVEIRGAVYREGMYQISGGVNTVKDLIKKADGIRGDAFLDRAQIQRENEDYTLVMIPVDLNGIINGTSTDIPLKKNDVLYVPSIHDLKEERTLTIHGEVAKPGSYTFADNMTIEDLIIQAGGLLETASTSKVDVSRRIKDPQSTSPVTTVGETFTFNLKNGFLINDGTRFYLAPFDEVYVRKSPAYYEQQNVSISGEVVFRGTYALSKKNERLSDLVAKAGGVTKDAYIKGARLMREMTDEEKRRKEDAERMTRQAGQDSVYFQQLDLSTTYPVGINLDKALNNPGSDYDLVLRKGDQLIIPEYVNTIKINGAVMYPNTVLYKKGEDFKYYLNQAGGYSDLARKRRAYVIYMNGTVARLKKSDPTLLQPGCEIIIPSKEKKSKMSTSEIITIGTSVASLAAVIASLVNLFK